MRHPDQRTPRRTITVIDTHYVRRQMAASHLLIEGNNAIFIDTGTAKAIDYLLTALTEENLSPDDVRHIILTHIHLDHAGGAGILMQHFPRASLLVHPKGAEHMIEPEKLLKASIDIYGTELFERLYGTITAVDKERVVAAGDGYLLEFNGRKLHFFDTPGHARHHVSIWDPASGGIFTGDTLGLAYPELQIPGKPPFLIPTTSPTAFDPEALERSIKRLLTLQPTTFYLTHFGPVQAHPDAVSRLLALLHRHAALGRLPQVPEPDRLATLVQELLHGAYTDYCRENNGRQIDDDRFNELLAGDIALNAQGIAVWAARQRNEAPL